MPDKYFKNQNIIFYVDLYIFSCTVFNNLISIGPIGTEPTLNRGWNKFALRLHVLRGEYISTEYSRCTNFTFNLCVRVQVVVHSNLET
jgi:hypothetical protein